MSIWKDPAKRTDKKNAPLYDRAELEPLIPKVKKFIEDFNGCGFSVPVRSVIVFGSYAAGAEKCHDLDIAIVLDNPPRTICGDIIATKNVLTEKLYGISSKIEVHFIDPNHCYSVNQALLIYGPMTHKYEPENHSYVFSGPHEFIYVQDKRLHMDITLANFVVHNNAFVTGVFTTNFLGFLCCYSFFGYVYDNEDTNELVRVKIDTIVHMGGSDMDRLGAPTEKLRQTLESLLFRAIRAQDAEEF